MPSAVNWLVKQVQILYPHSHVGKREHINLTYPAHKLFLLDLHPAASPDKNTAPGKMAGDNVAVGRKHVWRPMVEEGGGGGGDGGWGESNTFIASAKVLKRVSLIGGSRDAPMQMRVVKSARLRRFQPVLSGLERRPNSPASGRRGSGMYKNWGKGKKKKKTSGDIQTRPF